MAEGERTREGSQRSAVEMQSPLLMYICVSALMCVLFEEEKECVCGVWGQVSVCSCVCALLRRVRERETGQRVKVIML